MKYVKSNTDTSILKLKSAIQYGKDTVEEYKRYGEEVPNNVYERLITLQDDLIQLLG